MSQFTRSVPFQTTIAPNPRLRMLYILRCIYMYVFALSLAGAICSFLFPLHISLLRELLFLSYSIMVCILAVLAFREERFYQRIERLRLAAAQGDPRLLSHRASTPWERDLSLSLPWKIWFRCSRSLMGWIVFLWMTVLIAVFWLNTLFGLPPIMGWIPLPPLVLVFGLVCLLLARYRIVVTEQGIGLPQRNWLMNGEGGSWVAWDEVRLFTCSRAWGERTSSEIIDYELSSATGVVRWREVGIPRGWQTPPAPKNLHNAHRWMLCEVVQAKTGLPLYDLSRTIEREEDAIN